MLRRLDAAKAQHTPVKFTPHSALTYKVSILLGFDYKEQI